MEFLSQLRSSRALSDKDLIDNDSDMASIVGQIDFTDDLKVNLFRKGAKKIYICLLYTSPSPRDGLLSRMPSSA